MRIETTSHAVLTIVSSVLFASVAPSFAAPGDIETVVGGPGQGPRLSVSQSPLRAIVHGTTLYVADPSWHVVRAIDLVTGDENVVLGSGHAGCAQDGAALAASLDEPLSLAVDSVGALYVGDVGCQLVLRVADGTVTRVAGIPNDPSSSGDGGPASVASVDQPVGLAIDSSDRLYIAEGGSRIRRVDVYGDGIIDTFAASVGRPADLAIDAANRLYVPSAGDNVVRRVETDGSSSIIAGTGAPGFSGDGGQATAAQLNYPSGVAVDALGRVYVVDGNNYRVRRIAEDQTIATVAGSGVPGVLGIPDGIPATSAALRAECVAADPSSGFYVCDHYYRLRKVAGDGTMDAFAGTGAYGPFGGFGGDGGLAVDAQLNGPLGAAADGAGRIYVDDAFNARLRRVDLDGTIATVATGNVKRPAVDSLGRVYFGDFVIRRRAIDGTIATIAGGGTEQAAFDLGRCADLDGLPATDLSLAGTILGIGLDDDLYTLAGSCVLRIDAATGAITGRDLAAIPGGYHGQAIDTQSGSVYLAYPASHRVVRAEPGGSIVPFAGSGTAGYSGDGGDPAAAELDYPTGVAVDAAGIVYVLDSRNHVVRRIAGGVISTVAGSGVEGFSGDGSAATAATLSTEFGNGYPDLSIDRAGNLLVADVGNRRIRRVTSTYECGNGAREGAESCDLGPGNSDAPDAPCRTDCGARRCGDGTTDPGDGEQCDDGPPSSGDGCDALCRTENNVEPTVVPPSGGMVSTGSGTSALVPVQASVTVPPLGEAGTVAIKITSSLGAPPSGYTLAGKQIEITAPDGSVEVPLVFEFEVGPDAALPGEDPASLAVFRNGVFVAPCADPSRAIPDEPFACVRARQMLPGGGALISINAQRASVWTLASRLRFSEEDRLCRKEVRKQVRTLFAHRLGALRKCVDKVQAGKIGGPCPDPATATALAKRAARVTGATIAKRCTPGAIAGLQAERSCAGAGDAAAVAACVITEATAAASSLLRVEYASPNVALPGKPERACQASVGRAMGQYATVQVTQTSACLDKLDDEKVAACPDRKLRQKLEGAALRAAAAVLRSCSTPVVELLESGGFAGSCGGVSSVEGLVSCQASDHEAISSALTRLLP